RQNGVRNLEGRLCSPALESPHPRRRPLSVWKEEERLLKTLRQNIDLLIFVLIVAGFTLVAAQRLGKVPVPQVDESYMMQTSYEMLNRGALSLPFRRFIGGNIENNWHSLTPVHYVIQTAFFKVFGWGISEGRAFNLTLSIIVLLLVFLI